MSEMPFRSHHEVVAVASPLYRSLGAEWVALGLSPTSAIAVARWGRQHPALAPHASLGAVVDAIDDADGAGTDVLLGALIATFQAGAQLAGRVVLQAMLPKLTRMTVATSPTSSDDTWAEDRRHIIVAEFWTVLTGYPLARRPTRVAANLALDTLHRVTAGRRAPTETAMDLTAPGGETTRSPVWSSTPQRVDDDAGCEQGRELGAVLAWAREHDLVSEADAALITTIYSRPSTHGAFESEAAHLGITAAAVRQRCSRAVRAITRAVRAQTSAGALHPADMVA